MKRIASVVAGVLLMSGSSLLVAGAASPRTISVTGTVDTKTAPDQIVWSINLTDSDKDLREAKKRNDAKIESVLALRKELEIGEGDLETGYVNIRREYEHNQNGYQGEFKYFVVSRSVTIRQRDLKRFDKYLDTLVSSAEMEVNFSFESSRIHEVRAETRLAALKVAKEKAAAMAEVVGAKLGQVLTISEHPQGGSEYDQSSNSHNNGNGTFQPTLDAGSERFVPGAINVRVTVYAIFGLK